MSTDDGKRHVSEIAARLKELTEQRDDLAAALRLVTMSNAWARLENDSRHVIRFALDRAERNR